MTTSHKYFKKVFVSSTYEDLKEYRKAVIETVQRFGWFAVAMESFVSQDERPKGECFTLIKKCDVYVGILAHRYGYIPEGDTQSITEQEYRCAQNEGLKCLIFMVDEKYPWRKEWIDRDKAEVSLIALKNELKSRHLCSFFSTQEDLAVLVSASLAKYTRDPLVKQLQELTQKLELPAPKQVPTIRLEIFQHSEIVTDVQCTVINESHFPTSVKTFLDATIGCRDYELPVPGHYRGEETWDLPAKAGFKGHFDMEEYILAPAGFSYCNLKKSPKLFAIRIKYSALTQRGEWYHLGQLTYRFNFDIEDWQVMP